MATGAELATEAVTVVATDGSAADAYATAFYALGVKGPDLMGHLKNPPELAVSWLEQSANGKFHKRTNQAFDKLAKNENPTVLH